MWPNSSANGERAKLEVIQCTFQLTDQNSLLTKTSRECCYQFNWDVFLSFENMPFISFPTKRST